MTIYDGGMTATSRPRAHRPRPLLLACLALSCSLGCAAGRWGPASPDPTVVSITPVTFAADSGVSEAVLDKCKLDRRLPHEIAKYAKVDAVLAESADGGAKLLQLQVTKIFAPGGGHYSGPKQIDLHGDLVAGGQVIASFDARRSSMRGDRTCKMLRFVSQGLARKDVKKWLSAPTMGAQLGEFAK